MNPDEQLQAALFDSLSTPLLVVQRSGAIRLGNAAAGLFWRMPPARLRDYALHTLFAEEPRLPAAVLRAIDLDAGSHINGIRIGQGPPQERLVLRAQVDPVPGTATEPALALVTLWDETHRAQMEAAARERELMDSLGVVVRRLAHELQNPLSGVKGATQLLARRLPEGADYAEFPHVIQKELERLERLIRDMLGYGAEPPLAPRRFNVHELVDEVLWFVANSGAEVRLERLYDPSLPDVRADRDRVHQVLLNLVRNAVEASPPGGCVRVRTELSAPWQDREPLPDPGGTYLRIDVEDEGAGVPDEIRDRLFNPFHTTKRAGTGLGLAISYQIARAHGGALRYHPAQRQGTVFSFYLPLTAAGPER